MDLKKKLLIYSLNLATTIAELYYKNKSYIKVNCRLPQYDLKITKDNLPNLPLDKPSLIVVNASHKDYGYNAMNPNISIEYFPNANKICIYTAYIINDNDFDNIIDSSNVEIHTAEYLGKKLYDLMMNTQDYYKQQLIDS